MKDEETEESFDEELDESFSEDDETDFEDEEDEFELVSEEKQQEPESSLVHEKKIEQPEVHHEPTPPPIHHEKMAPPERKFERITQETLELPVCIEVAEISMSAKQLIDLSIGNFIDLNIPVTGEVTLIIHGKAIGKGELVQIGEKIGVRVTEIGI